MQTLIDYLLKLNPLLTEAGAMSIIKATEKTIEQIKNEVAKRNNYARVFSALTADEQALLLDEVATEYAKECCCYQIHKCAENAETPSNYSYVDSESILNTPNVVTSK